MLSSRRRLVQDSGVRCFIKPMVGHPLLARWGQRQRPDQEAALKLLGRGNRRSDALATKATAKQNHGSTQALGPVMEIPEGFVRRGRDSAGRDGGSCRIRTSYLSVTNLVSCH